MLVTAPTDKKPGYYFPSSMMDSDWEELNTQRQRKNKTIFIFCSREFVKPSIANHVGGNNLVPTEGLIRHYSSKTRVFKDEDDKEGTWVLRPTHMALLSIRGTRFRLHDVNNFEGMDTDANPWVNEFYDLMKKVAVPKIYRNFNLTAGDVMPGYGVDANYFSMG